MHVFSVRITFTVNRLRLILPDIDLLTVSFISLLYSIIEAHQGKSHFRNLRIPG